MAIVTAKTHHFNEGGYMNTIKSIVWLIGSFTLGYMGICLLFILIEHVMFRFHIGKINDIESMKVSKKASKEESMETKPEE